VPSLPVLGQNRITRRGAIESWVRGDHVPFLPVLGRNRIAVEATPEVGWGRPRAIFTCPRPEPDIHRGATKSWVGATTWHFTCPRPEPYNRLGATGSLVGDGHVQFLPVLGRNRISIEAPPEVGWGRPRAIFTCPRPEPDIHRGATGSWVGADHAPFLPVLCRNRISIEAPPEVGWGTATCHFTCPRPEPDIHRGATGSWAGDGHVLRT
jgi:hypothetical protein